MELTSAEWFEKWCQISDRYGYQHALAAMAWTFYRATVEREERAS